MAALSYHEQEDIENTKRIRGILKDCHRSVPISSAALNLVHQRAPGLRMPMI